MKYIVLFLACACLISFTPPQDLHAQTAEPVAKFLKPDGTLNVPPHFSGSLDPAGWKISLGPHGEPRFMPQAQTTISGIADTSWDSRFSFHGISGQVYAIAVMGTDIYVGGNFISAGVSGASYIAKWNGSSWSPLGSGVDNTVLAMAVIGTDLYVGGWFYNAGTSPANHIAKWDGHNWTALGLGMNEWYVNSLAVIGTDLYAGGNFEQAGGISANRVAKWDGSTWSALGSGLNSNVNALTVIGTNLYAGGLFDSAGGVSANFIAEWNGNSWSALGAGTSGWVYALASVGTDLYAGGSFASAGGVTVNNVAKWDGSSWSALGLGVGGGAIFTEVNALATNGTDLYVGGSFTLIGVLNVNNVAKWNGSWSLLGTGTSNVVYSLAAVDSGVLAGGYFATAGGMNVSSIGKWSGTSWSPLYDGSSGLGLNYQVVAMASSGSDLYVSGSFVTTDNATVNDVLKWDGNSWSTLGSGMNADVYALAVMGGYLYAGGYFDTAGGVPASYMARWDGTSWSPVGTGTNGPVNALTTDGTNLYAGGSFFTAGGNPASYIAQWNGSSWSALGTGVNNLVNTLTVMGTDLYAGGDFTIAGGITVNYIAKWDGSTWSALGSGVSGANLSAVFALAARGPDLYVGGVFDTAGGIRSQGIAKWDGSGWSTVGTGIGGTYPIVTALAATGTDLYAAGYFTTAGAVSVNHLAKWDGSAWSALGSGTNGNVYVLHPTRGDLYVGGYFSMAGGKPASCFSRWRIANTPPWVWANNLGATPGDLATALATDDSGNVYTTGYFIGSVNLGNGSMPSAGGADIYIAKYDPAGNLVWATTGGGTGDEVAYGIAVDHTGNVYITGYFNSNPITFDTVSVAKPSTDYDMFLVKYNAAGRAIWARVAGGTLDEYGQSVAVDGGGNVYIVGQFTSSSLQIGSTPALTNAGSFDVYIAKYNSAGTALWSSQIGGPGVEEAYKVISDSSGNVYCTGYFTSSSLTIGSTPALTNNGHEDMFVAKFNTNGTALWSQSAGGDQRDEGRCIAVDGSGNVYVGGDFESSTITFGSTTVGDPLYIQSFLRTFLVKYSPQGSPLWAIQPGAENAAVPTAMTIDKSGSSTLAGYYTSPSLPVGRFTLWNTNPGQYDVFIAKHDSLGQSLWVKSIDGGRSNESPSDIEADRAGNILVVGEYTDTSLRFDTHDISSGGSTFDGFLAKIGPVSGSTPAEQTVSVTQGWNLVSLPAIPVNDSVQVLFPGASSGAFAYTSGGYQIRLVMDPGSGYWLKYRSSGSVNIDGTAILLDTIQVTTGWNLIGAISQPIPVSSITSIPPGMVTSNIFGYTNGYVKEDSIDPGNGYWIKVSGNGQLILSAGPTTSANHIRIVPTSELPPSPPASGISDNPMIPDHFALDQNYPNPFNPSTVLRYQLPVESRVTITIYNVVGQKIATLVDGVEKPGFKSVEWNASRWGSGVYFCRFRASYFTQTRKLVLMK